ncbi:GDP-mannose 4,6-dehydratase [Methanothermococcus okinawensis]|uniref:GDP-mannose 4,6-dehydratase n=1 Tax=Methanothermococcus okinawensis (strain DSM 14208 / JCM 11175 / IH1) TaxID=647113 RepID=F8AJT1_METOI|nr:GDP-mannose 4,6-dehydratase [Methanothermococcus okinawensis]AEH07279.1 GDP-mannose 4,6-dehydratase [Methanothermococcus okinawensis IH1]
MKKALITGITGQDGYYLTKLLLEKGYEIHGIVRRNSQNSLGNLEHLPKEELEQINIHWGDITDNLFIDETIKKIQPDEIYHLAAQSFVGFSFKNPRFTYDVNIGGTLNVANAVKEYSPSSKLYFAATSELYGKVQEIPQKETTPFYPRSPYGVSKLAGFWTIKNYRESYNLFMSNGILFNHESPMRGPEFVTRKITMAVAKIYNGLQDYVELGNLSAKRDWGYAGDYVYGMWKILHHDKPDDFVLATNETHTVREFVENAFKVVGIDIEWEGEGINEIGKDANTGKVLVKVNPEFFRPAEVDILIGDYSKAKKELGWEPKVKFEELVKMMVEKDLERIKLK